MGGGRPGRPRERGGLVLTRPLRDRRRAGAAAVVAALALAVLLSLAVGANPLPVGRVWAVLTHPDGSEASAVVWTERWPRTLVGVAAGVAFGVAGALVQALTRNPLADPGILGVNAGAGLAVTVGVALLGSATTGQYVWFAFAGAAAATVLVHLVGAGGRAAASPVTLVLAGVALGAVLGGVATFLTLIDPEVFRAVRSWGLGSLARTGLGDLAAVAPFLLVGLLVALALTGSLNALALGEDSAASLGTRVGLTRVLVVVAVTLLAGGGTALTGGLSFVGLVVPHVVRWSTGPDQRWVVAGSALAAPVLVLLADVVGRVVARPGEVQVGVLTAVVGAPVLIALARRRRASAL